MSKSFASFGLIAILVFCGTPFVAAQFNLPGATGGGLQGSASNDIDMVGYTITDSTSAMDVGTAATTGHSLGAGDVICGGDLEIDGEIYADGGITMGGDIDWDTNADQLTLGSFGSDYLVMRPVLNSGYIMGVSNASTAKYNLIFSSLLNRSKNHNTSTVINSATSNPRLHLFSSTDPTTGGGIEFSTWEWNSLSLPNVVTGDVTADPNHSKLYVGSNGLLRIVAPSGSDVAVGAASTAFKSYSHSTGPLGNHYMAGSWQVSTTDANLSQASPTQTFGTATRAYAAHAFIVAAGAGTVDAGTVSLRVTGTSINDAGTRTTSDAETIVADITTLDPNQFIESSKKWLGQITYELVNSGATTYSLDFNYGFNKYEDWGNRSFTVTDLECVGEGGATDTIDIQLYRQDPNGWVYHATSFEPTSTLIAQMSTDHSTDRGIASGTLFAYKRANLNFPVDGANDQGVVIKLVTGANNSIDSIDCHVGASF